MIEKILFTSLELKNLNELVTIQERGSVFGILINQSKAGGASFIIQGEYAKTALAAEIAGSKKSSSGKLKEAGPKQKRISTCEALFLEMMLFNLNFKFERMIYEN